MSRRVHHEYTCITNIRREKGKLFFLISFEDHESHVFMCVCVSVSVCIFGKIANTHASKDAVLVHPLTLTHKKKSYVYTCMCIYVKIFFGNC